MGMSPRTKNVVDNIGKAQQLKMGFVEPTRSRKLKTEVTVWYNNSTHKKQ